MTYISDFLVIGSGIAGLSFALKAARFGTVNIVTKKEKSDTSTNLAQGGIASAIGEDDSLDLHIRDTLISGSGLCDENVVRIVVTEGPDRIRELLDLGVNFNLEGGQENTFELGREGGHSRRRIVHAEDMTGQEVERALVERSLNEKNIEFYEHHTVIDLITHYKLFRQGLVSNISEDSCYGAYVLDTKKNEVKTYFARVVVLCSGGAGKVYLYTSNPDIASGDGVAMGYRAGAVISNMEFVQFHPTCLYHPLAKNFLISEAVRGEGGKLINGKGREFMVDYHEMKELATRDVVARAVDSELKKSGEDCVFLDISHREKGFIIKRFPNIYQTCLSFGIDITKEPIPIVPAAHYLCGGVLTDTEARTNIPYLYALGEVACTGLHGANRLASNSLLEALVMADRAAKAVKRDLEVRSQKPFPEEPKWDPGWASDSDEAIVVSHNWEEIRRFMWNYVGLVRTNNRLQRARSRIRNIQKEIDDYYWNFLITSDLIELRNIATVAELIIESALSRKESRGLHYNLDYPQRNDTQYRRNTILKLGALPV
ncbi:MAG: L-aspartate oxidase [Deltaproteobacteria bacterium]|nr:L-aspartate oxidase [Deltaproteobacteria bacterium]MBW2052456.1 L-aspartate oxidase [Deltaproteobacteria bacterium]MBW2140428.1 L-aspartate oxidase [Deltaproteobacteria bacterium]MBW2322949.1 L-aspartate oxidase [Deltaproteobacteria bacterium]